MVIKKIAKKYGFDCDDFVKYLIEIIGVDSDPALKDCDLENARVNDMVDGYRQYLSEKKQKAIDLKKQEEAFDQYIDKKYKQMVAEFLGDVLAISALKNETSFDVNTPSKLHGPVDKTALKQLSYAEILETMGASGSVAYHNEDLPEEEKGNVSYGIAQTLIPLNDAIAAQSALRLFFYSKALNREHAIVFEPNAPMQSNNPLIRAGQAYGLIMATRLPSVPEDKETITLSLTEPSDGGLNRETCSMIMGAACFVKFDQALSEFAQLLKLKTSGGDLSRIQSALAMKDRIAFYKEEDQVSKKADYNQYVKKYGLEKYLPLFTEAKGTSESAKKVDEKHSEEAISIKGQTDIQEQHEEYLYCRKCGTKIPSDSVFCPKCGEKVVVI